MEQVFLNVIGIILIPLSIFGGIVVLFRSYESRRGIENIAASFGLKEMKPSVPYEATVGGQKYYYKYILGANGIPREFMVWIDCHSRGGFKIERETAFDRIFKILRITDEIQTGDSQFDSDFYINTNTSAFAHACFNSPERRLLVNELFNLNFNEILHDGLRLQIKIPTFNLPQGFDKTTIESVVTKLSAFSVDLPLDYFESKVLGTPDWIVKRRIIYVVSITCLVVGLVIRALGNAFFSPLDSSDLFINSLVFSIPAFIIFTVISINFLKGRSSSHWDLLYNLCIASIGLPLLGYYGMIIYNGYFDRSPTNYHDVVVVDKHYTGSGNSYTYYLKFGSWRENKTSNEIKVTKQVYEEADKGVTKIRVATRPGYLGYEWVVEFFPDIVSPGQRIEMTLYVVRAPPGTGCTLKKHDFVKGNISFRRDDPMMVMSVTPGFLYEISDADDEESITKMIFAAEVRSMKERGTTRGYTPNEFETSMVEIKDKKLYAMRYSIADVRLKPPLIMKYIMLIYLPADWRLSKTFYGFLIGIPQNKNKPFYDLKSTEIYDLIASFQTTHDHI